MKQFFKFMFASALGMIVAGGILLIIFFSVLFGAISSMEGKFGDNKKVSVKENSILHIKLDGPIRDRAPSDPFNNLNFGPFQGDGAIGLDQLLKSLKNAKEDDKIKGVYLEMRGAQAGMATLTELRAALTDFKESGKWIVSYGENYGQGSYFLATAGDEIYMYPEGSMDFSGLSATLMFFKGMLDKLDVEAQVIRGKNNKFKSAVEPFMYEQMSDANREQLTRLLSSVWDNMIADVAQSRDMTASELNMLADSLLVQSAPEALERGMIDRTLHADELMADLMERVEVEKEKDLHFVTVKKYAKYKPKKGDDDDDDDDKRSRVKERIAVIYASGEIRSGKSEDDAMGSETIAAAIKKARQDSNVKAIVFRVNSPGGSALASDVIWRETVLARQEKPFVVSMGDLAASGGYYISAHADRIFAQPNTITGSIGVFGVIPNAKEFFNNKMGITFDRVTTNEHSDWLGIDRPLDDMEYRTIQRSVEMVYDTFLTRVSTGRGLAKAAVDSIGQGRVWTGTDALSLGLVDQLGGLQDAIDYAQEQADLEEYRIKSYPEESDPFEDFFKGLSGEAEEAYLRHRFGNGYTYFEQVRDIAEVQGIQARMPFVLHIQ